MMAMSCISSLTFENENGFLKKISAVLFFTVLTLLILSATAVAAEFKSGEGNVILSQNVNDNLFLSGGTVDYRGDVKGDLIVAGGNVDVNGNVDGSIVALSGRVKVLGKVKNNVYAAGGTVELSGASVGKDIFVAGGGIAASRETTVAGSAYVASGSLLSNGTLGKDLVAGSGDVQIGGKIGRDARISCEKLTLAQNALIGRNLIYRSPKKAVFEKGSKVSGTVKFTRTEEGGERKVPPTGLIFIGVLTLFIFGFLMILVLALITTAVAPGFVKSSSTEMEKRPWICLGTGFLTLAVGPVAILLLFITVLGIPLALIALSVYLLLIYVGKIFAAHWIGERMIIAIWKVPEPNIYGAVALGLFVLAVIGLIPIIGWLAGLVATLVGIGAALREVVAVHKKAREGGII